MKTNLSKDPIGEVNTPLSWGLWAAERYGLVNRWLEGATVLDPTMGEGNLLEAFLYAGVQRGIPPDRLPVQTLFGIERQGEKITQFLQRVKDRYALELPPGNFTEADLLTGNRDKVFPGFADEVAPDLRSGTRIAGTRIGEGRTQEILKALAEGPSSRFEEAESHSSGEQKAFSPVDILFGNPPWITFASLPDSYKKQIKELFLRYSLVQSRNQVLLGRSRVDLSALVVLVAISRFLRSGGEGVFFLPLSLFFGEGAGEGFRQFRSEGTPFCVREVVELPMAKVFPGVSTRGGLVYLARDMEQCYPVPVYRAGLQTGDLRTRQRYPVPAYREGTQANAFQFGHNFSAPVFGEIELWKASPIEGPQSSWILYRKEHPFPNGVTRITIPSESLPRQGINTCGANDLFFFDSVEKRDETVWKASNSTLTCLLPSAYLFPLLTSQSFREQDPIPHKWVFLPYQQDGRLLSPQQVEGNPHLRQFVLRYRDRLEARKGVLIQHWIRKGYFWALFGVGAYCFYPWKIFWEAAGKKKFTPRLWKGEWQANQSLHGYLPFRSLEEATRVLEALKDRRIETYLLSLQAEGTLNWAQPGRMRRLFTLVSP